MVHYQYFFCYITSSCVQNVFFVNVLIWKHGDKNVSSKRTNNISILQIHIFVSLRRMIGEIYFTFLFLREKHFAKAPTLFLLHT